VVRKQIILKEVQKRALEKLAHDQSRSFSEIVREMIDAQLRLDRESQLQNAAERLREDYLHDPELTAFSAIEGDAIHEED
jgi:predicted DNA-binding protein